MTNTMISALATNSDAYRVTVRVGRIWEAINRKTRTVLHTNITLIDEKVQNAISPSHNTSKLYHTWQTEYVPMLLVFKLRTNLEFHRRGIIYSQ